MDTVLLLENVNQIMDMKINLIENSLRKFLEYVGEKIPLILGLKEMLKYLKDFNL